MPLCFLDFLTWLQFPRIFVGDCVFQRPMPRFTHMSPIDLGWSHKAKSLLLTIKWTCYLQPYFHLVLLSHIWKLFLWKAWFTSINYYSKYTLRNNCSQIPNKWKQMVVESRGRIWPRRVREKYIIQTEFSLIAFSKSTCIVTTSFLIPLLILKMLIFKV